MTTAPTSQMILFMMEGGLRMSCQAARERRVPLLVRLPGHPPDVSLSVRRERETHAGQNRPPRVGRTAIIADSSNEHLHERCSDQGTGSSNTMPQLWRSKPWRDTVASESRRFPRAPGGPPVFEPVPWHVNGIWFCA